MKSDLTFAILLGGALEPDERVRTLVHGARAIAADGGMRACEALGLTPELWVGDFDSAPTSWSHDIAACRGKPFPAEKNFTDGELAVEEAIARGATAHSGWCVSGRANRSRAFASAAGRHPCRTGPQCGADLGHRRGGSAAAGIARELDLPAGSLLSVMPLRDLGGSKPSGCKYPLDEADIALARRAPYRMWRPVRLTASLQSGRALMLARPHDFSGS
jgi:thiamine pyrophosphokinase